MLVFDRLALSHQVILHLNIRGTLQSYDNKIMSHYKYLNSNILRLDQRLQIVSYLFVF